MKTKTSQRDYFKKHPELQQYRKKIPNKVSKENFEKYIEPYLSKPKTGFKKIEEVPLDKQFNYIIKVLRTGSQWSELVIDKNKEGKAEIHYTNLWRKFNRWANDGSLYKVFVNSLQLLNKAGKLKIDLLHADGTNTIAKKGEKK